MVERSSMVHVSVVALLVVALSGCVNEAGTDDRSAEVPATETGSGGAEACTVLTDAPLVVGERTVADGTYCIEETWVVSPGATLRFENAVIRLNAEKPVCDPSMCLLDLSLLRGAGFQVINSTITTDREGEGAEGLWAVSGTAAVVEVVDSILHKGMGFSMGQPGLAPSRMEGNLFLDGYKAASFGRGAEVRFTDNIIENLTWGLDLQDTTATVVDNTMSHVELVGINVLSSLVNGKTFPGDYVIEGNQVSFSGTGLFFRTEQPHALTGNSFINNSRGLFLSIPADRADLVRGLPTATDNVFIGNRLAVEIGTVAHQPATDMDDAVVIQDNLFLETGCTEIYAHQHEGLALTVDATQNWWGSPEGPRDRGPECAAFTGDMPVEAAPWTTGPP